MGVEVRTEEKGAQGDRVVAQQGKRRAREEVVPLAGKLHPPGLGQAQLRGRVAGENLELRGSNPEPRHKCRRSLLLWQRPS